MRSQRLDVKFRSIKSEIRILGVDDCPFVPKQPGRVDVIGIVLRGGYWVDGAMRTTVELDGFDATDEIARMVYSSPHLKQLRVIMLNGITFGGFNIVDVHELFELTGVPVLALTREKVNLEAIRKALMNLSRWKDRLQLIEKTGVPLNINVRNTELHIQRAGISIEDAERIVRLSSTHGNIPEPLRVAHIIASVFINSKNQ